MMKNGLSRRFLRSYKKNTAAIFFSFALTFMLLTVLLTLIHTNFRISGIQAQAEFTPSDCYIDGLSQDQVDTLAADPEISWMGVQQGESRLYERNHQQVHVTRNDGEAATMMATVLEGKLPEGEGEVAAARRIDVVFLCLGLNATLEGEEGDAANSYAGADRKDLGLPDPQCRLLKAVCETGTPVVLLVASGGAVSLPYAQERCAAILHVWYPGQMGGIAVGDILFGNTVPSGKLPVTFYRDIADLPPFEDYSMKGRTYRYLTAEPLYPFGYGLSYAEFAYANARVTVDEEQENIHVRVAVTNTSAVPAEEITQVYIKVCDSPLAVPNYSLVQFGRNAFEAGETKEIELDFPVERLRVVDEEGNYVWENAKVYLYVGGSQPDERSCALTGHRVLRVELFMTEEGKVLQV